MRQPLLDRWVINVFGWLAVSGIYLMVSYTVISLVGLSELGFRGGGQLPVTEVLCWVFLLPLKLLEVVGVSWAGQITCWVLNALVYGSVLWFAPRMWKLMRRKPEPE